MCVLSYISFTIVYFVTLGIGSACENSTCSCDDVAGDAGCQATCVDDDDDDGSFTSYTCRCNLGYQVQEDEETCSGIFLHVAKHTMFFF